MPESHGAPDGDSDGLLIFFSSAVVAWFLTSYFRQNTACQPGRVFHYSSHQIPVKVSKKNVICSVLKTASGLWISDDESPGVMCDLNGLSCLAMIQDPPFSCPGLILSSPLIILDRAFINISYS